MAKLWVEPLRVRNVYGEGSISDSRGDTDAALEAVERVRAVDAALADDLAVRVQSFRFEEILASLESTNTHE